MGDPNQQLTRKLKGLLALAGLGLFLSGCSSPPAMDVLPEPVAASEVAVLVNGEPISVKEFDDEFRLMKIYYSAVSEKDMPAIKVRLFEQVIDRHIMLQEARRLGITLSQAEVDQVFKQEAQSIPDDFLLILKTRGVSVDAWKRKLLQEKIVQKLVQKEVNDKVKVSTDQVNEYYWNHLGDFWLPEAVRVRHLIVQRKGKLQQVLAALKKGEDFSKIVETFSLAPGASQGGDWHFMNTDWLPPEYLRVISNLKVGRVSKPLQDGFGYHLFELVAWRPKRMRTLEEVRDQIHDQLLTQAENDRFKVWMMFLKEKSKVEVKEAMAPVVGAALEGPSEK